MLVPGFEPGSPPRKGGMMDRTTPHERRVGECSESHNRFDMENPSFWILTGHQDLSTMNSMAKTLQRRLALQLSRTGVSLVFPKTRCPRDSRQPLPCQIEFLFRLGRQIRKFGSASFLPQLSTPTSCTELERLPQGIRQRPHTS